MAKKSEKLSAAKKIAEKLKNKKSARYVAQGQNAPQSKAWTEASDESVKAKPIGFRWTSVGASRLGKKETSKPTMEDIEKYKNKTFKVKGETHRYLYSEKRVDKSDRSVKAKFKKGGQTQGQYAKAHGGTSSKGADGQKIAKPVGWRFRGTGAKGYEKPSQAYIEKQLKLSPDDRTIYKETRRDKSDVNPSKDYISLKRGGMNQVGRQYENYSEDMDGQKLAKPVGYRYTDRLAKRLGVNPHSRPTQAHIEKYLGKGVYMEKRQDKSDVKPSSKYISLAKGGIPKEFGGRYNGVYNNIGRDVEMDKEWVAKPVGYRFTNAKAKRLGLDPHTKPTQAQIEKYRGNGVYFENREDKSDIKPSGRYPSYMSGGVADGQWISAYARGGVERISNSESRAYTENMIPFKANNLEGKTLSNGDYVVLSYGYYPIWWYCKAEGKWYGNSSKYSVTTSKQMSQSRPSYDATMLSRSEMEQRMMQHHAKFEDGGILSGIMGETDGASLQNVGGSTFSNADLTSHMDIHNPNF